MATDKNSLHEVDTWMFFRWFFKARVAVFLVARTFDITKLRTLRREPDDKVALTRKLESAWESREREARPAVFKLRVTTPKKLSIKQQLVDGKKQIESNRPNVTITYFLGSKTA